jgi:hypothetical protein
MRRVLGARQTAADDSIATLSSQNNLALLLLDAKKPAEAEVIFREMIEGLDKALPEDHWMRWQGRMNLAQALVDQEKFEEAEPLMLTGYDGLVKTLPPGSTRLPGAANELAILYKKMGRAEEEAKWRERAGQSR